MVNNITYNSYSQSSLYFFFEETEGEGPRPSLRDTCLFLICFLSYSATHQPGPTVSRNRSVYDWLTDWLQPILSHRILFSIVELLRRMWTSMSLSFSSNYFAPRNGYYLTSLYWYLYVGWSSSSRTVLTLWMSLCCNILSGVVVHIAGYNTVILIRCIELSV